MSSLDRNSDFLSDAALASTTGTSGLSDNQPVLARRGRTTCKQEALSRERERFTPSRILDGNPTVQLSKNRVGEPSLPSGEGCLSLHADYSTSVQKMQEGEKRVMPTQPMPQIRTRIPPVPWNEMGLLLGLLNRKFWYLMSVSLILLLSACQAGLGSHLAPVQPITADSLNIAQHPTSTTSISIPKQVATSTTKNPTVPTSNRPNVIPGSSKGPEPYGPPPPLTAEEIQLTQQLFALINHDRAVRGLYPFTWNATLAGGALLHSWNMVHCGFSHTCPDGLDQCVRIANEGFAGYTDCGENIGWAGPSTPPWNNVYAVQESMMNEGPTGWHYMHLTSTTLHRIGVGIYVDPNGWDWFTEDMVS